MPGTPTLKAGDWASALREAWPGAIAGILGWTSAVTGTGAANSAGTSDTSDLAVLRFPGAVVSVVGTTATGIASNELQGMVINNANGMGIDAAALMGIGVALPTATNAYAYLFGIFDSAGAVTTGNFIGLMFGWNPVTNAINIGWMLCADTVARLIGNTPTAGAIVIPSPAPNPTQTTGAPALQVPQDLHFRLESSLPQQPIGTAAAWQALKGAVNGVPSNTLVTSTGLQVYPAGIVPTNGFPNITAGWLGFKSFALAGTANSGKLITGAVAFSPLNIPQFG